MYQTIQTKIYPTLSEYVDGLGDELRTCHELVLKSMDVEQERQKKPNLTVEHLDHNMK